MPPPRAGLPNDTYPAKTPNPAAHTKLDSVLPPDGTSSPCSDHGDAKHRRVETNSNIERWPPPPRRTGRLALPASP